MKERDNLVQFEVEGALCGGECALVLGQEGHDLLEARQGIRTSIIDHGEGSMKAPNDGSHWKLASCIRGQEIPPERKVRRR